MNKRALDKLKYQKDKYSENPQLLFIAMWGIAHIGHFLRKGSVLDIFAWIVLLLAILVVFKPESSKRMAALAAVQLFYLFKEMPFTDNHLYIMGFINAGLLIAIAVSYAKKTSYLHNINLSMGYLCAAFLIAYFAAAFAKLNTGFFDTDYSCAVTMFYDSASIITAKNFLPSTLESLLPYYVTAAELSIPLLLLFRKTRYLGILVLVFFHLGISLSPTATALDFTIALFALAVPFLDRDAKHEVIRILYSLGKKTVGFFTASVYSWPFVIFLFLFLIKSSSRLLSLGIYPYWLLLAPFALLSGGILLITVFRIGLSWNSSDNSNPFRPLYPIHYLLLLFLIINAATPYLGIKTIGTFTMYSNLQTENSSSNHFLVDRYFGSMPLDDMVEVISSDHSVLNSFAQSGYWITNHELTRILSESPTSSVQFQRGGETFDINPAGSSTESIRKSFFKHKLMGHRVYDPENAVCLW